MRILLHMTVPHRVARRVSPPRIRTAQERGPVAHRGTALADAVMHVRCAREGFRCTRTRRFERSARASSCFGAPEGGESAARVLVHVRAARVARAPGGNAAARG